MPYVLFIWVFAMNKITLSYPVQLMVGILSSQPYTEGKQIHLKNYSR